MKIILIALVLALALALVTPSGAAPIDSTLEWHSASPTLM